MDEHNHSHHMKPTTPTEPKPGHIQTENVASPGSAVDHSHMDHTKMAATPPPNPADNQREAVPPESTKLKADDTQAEQSPPKTESRSPDAHAHMDHETMDHSAHQHQGHDHSQHAEHSHGGSDSPHHDVHNHEQMGHGVGGHAGHHEHMVADFRKRFWITLALTIPITLLSPMIMMLFGFHLDFPGQTSSYSYCRPSSSSTAVNRS